MYFYNKSNNEKTEIAALCNQSMTKKWTHQHYGGFLYVFVTLFEAKTVDYVWAKNVIFGGKKKTPFKHLRTLKVFFLIWNASTT